MSYIDPLYFVFLTAGITVGFGHCIGMCGPILVSLSLKIRKKGTLYPHVLYHSGRIITYTALGGIMGATGSFTLIAAHIAWLQKIILTGSGLLVMVMGLSMIGRTPWGNRFKETFPSGGIITKGFRKFFDGTSSPAYFPMGLLLGLLPCGPVYTALLAAAGSGMNAGSIQAGIIRGMGIMACFGMGTLPSLFLVAKLADMGWLKKRETIYRIGGFLMIVVGFYFIVKGIRY
ncbi:MAG: sulfite exporter TauE/SafE family protein [Thermodesulfobacteriota bacterium]